MAGSGKTVVGLDACAEPCAVRGDVSGVRERLPDAEARRRSAELFRLLGDPTRVAILMALLEAGELCVCDI